MSTGPNPTSESHFGPTSEPLDVSAFLRELTDAEAAAHTVFAQSAESLPETARREWMKLSEQRRSSIEAECSVHDVQKPLHDVIMEPRLMAHVMRSHELFTHSIYETAELSNRKKRKRLTAEEPSEEHPQVTALRRTLDAVRLKSWPLTLHAALFIRPPKQSDHNTLTTTKCLALPATASGPQEALLFVTVYDRLSWGHKLLSRSSQHVLLSSHTLGDMYDTIPCTSNEMPERPADDSDGMWQEATAQKTSGAVMCVEDTAYGDGESESDYSDRLLKCIQLLPESSRVSLQKGRPMHEVTFSSMQLRLHQPYWLCHMGDCEHFFVVDHVRAHHSSDPPLSKFPLTTQITPRLLDTCRACNKAPAVYSIVGDIRLGESPFVICKPCWRCMGRPKDEDARAIQVVPLPRHEFGWQG